MAVWSEIKSPQIKGAFNILAEHYQQERLAAEETLRKNSQKTIGDLFFESTKTISSNLINDNFIVYDLTDSLGNFFGQGKNTKDFVVSSNKKYAEEADFLISRLRYYLLEMAILPKREHTTVVSTEYLIFRSKNDISTHFLLPFCLSKPVQSILKWAQTGNEHPRFSSDELKRINIPDLLLHNANKITTLVEKAIQSNDDSQSLYTQAQQLLEQELGLDKLTFEKPVGYEARFSEVSVSHRLDAQHFRIKYNKLISQIKKYDWQIIRNLKTYNRRGIQPVYIENGEYDVVNSQHIGMQHLDYDGFEKTSEPNFVLGSVAHVKYGDLLIYTTGAYIGSTNVFLSNKPALASNHVNILRLKTHINSAYMAVVFQSIIGKLQTEKHSRGSAQAELYPADIDKFIVPLLHPDIQKEIGDLVHNSLKLKKESKALLEQAKSLVESLIEEAAAK